MTEVQRQFHGERRTFSANGAGTIRRLYARKSPRNFHKINSKWIVNLNVKSKIIKLKTWRNSSDREFSGYILDDNQKHNPWKSKLEFIKYKNVCSMKDTRMKR